MTIITTSCPAALWPAYEQLRRCVVPTEPDADHAPSGAPAWVKDGTEYVASSMPRQDWVFRAMEPLEEPEWGADMDLAAQAQAALVIWPPMGDEEPGPLPEAQPDKITVIVGPNGIEALGMMGLRVVDYE